jgi:hypothetical protein
MANVNGTTDVLSYEEMETMDVMYSVYGALSDADESLMHDANAFNATIGSKVDNILLSWIYTTHGGIVEEASKALEAIGSEIDNHLHLVKIKITEVLTTYAMYGKVMQIVFVEKDANVAIIGLSNDIFKYRVEDYARNRGVSLKSLRFSFKEKPLFVSSLGQQTLADLGIQDLDEIVVTSITNNNSNKENVVNNHVQLRKGKTKKKKNNQTKKVKKQPIQRAAPVMTSEDYKAQHSLAFTKVLEELQPHLKEIRTELNSLDLQCQPKKIKSCGKKSSDVVVDHFTLLGSEIGGKAGKSHFVVQVGDVENLYKTTKPSTVSYQQRHSSSIPTLDLHGCTKDETIVKLNESLEVWFEMAMTGSYPFVITAVIVCGCGSQVLSETVQDWIKSTSRVRNAPKNHYV